jgi:hypothetical protein
LRPLCLMARSRLVSSSTVTMFQSRYLLATTVTSSRSRG